MPRPGNPGRGIFLASSFWLIFFLALTALAYWPGLGGPFLFDDPPNIIQPIQAWMDGQTGWQEVVFGNGSGPLGRPISNLSFLLNALVSGLAVAPFKLTNLAIHLLSGVLVYALLKKLLRRDPILRKNAGWAALAVTALWLLHPIQVSTVLYVVQRMAQLSTFFMLVALLAYVHARFALIEGKKLRGFVLLWLTVPAATLAATLSKENGILVPALCAVIELGYFQSEATERRSGAVKAWFGLFLMTPAILVTGWYGWHWQRLVDSYVGRSFTLEQRLLTQPRAIVDYMSALLWPRGPALGIYTDDFAASTGLLAPLSTIIAIGILLVLIIVAWKLRKIIPAFFTGIGLYFCGHAMESSIFPLLLHFEHRNYFPSLGFFLAIVGLIGWAAPRFVSSSGHPQRFGRLLNVSAVLIVVMLGFATFARAQVWSSFPLIAQQGALQHPQSRRAQLDYASVLQLAGQHNEARQVFEHMLTMNSEQARHVGAIDLVVLDCMVNGQTDQESVNRVKKIAGAKLQLGEMLAFENLGNWLRKGGNECQGLEQSQLADLIVHTVDAAPQPPQLGQLWRSRFNAAQLYASSGDLLAAQNQAALAWMTGAADPAVGVFLAAVYLEMGEKQNAGLIIRDTARRVKFWDKRNQKLLSELEIKLAQHRIGGNP